MDIQTAFDDARWIHELAEALEKLGASQARYKDDLVEIRPLPVRRSSTRPDWYDTHPESDDLRLLYRQALAEGDPDIERHFHPLRDALTRVLDILRQHPVLDRVLAVPGGTLDFRLDITGIQAAVQLLEVAVGLITRFPSPLPGKLCAGGTRTRQPLESR